MDSSESQAWTSLGHTLPSPFCVRGRRGAPLSTLSPPILCQRCPDIYTVQLSFLCKKLWTCAKRWHRWAASFQVERGKQWANFLTKSAVCQVVARAMEKTKARKRGEGVRRCSLINRWRRVCSTSFLPSIWYQSLLCNCHCVDSVTRQ